MKRIIIMVLLILAITCSFCYAQLFDVNAEVIFDDTLKYSDLLSPIIFEHNQKPKLNEDKLPLYTYHKYINEIYKASDIKIGKGIGDYLIKGYADGTFRPDAPITRAEFIKMAIGLSNSQSFDYFIIPTERYNKHWAAPYLFVAEMQGVIEPGEMNYLPGLANVDDPITRLEVIRILSKIQINMKGIPIKTGNLANYEDVNKAELSAEDERLIIHAANYNLLEGIVAYENDEKLYLRPDENITRAEAVRALLRVY